MAGAIVGLGELLGLDAVAEGIETTGQRQAMVDLGCRHGQGYLFSRPVDLATFRQMLAQDHPALGEPLLAQSSRTPSKLGA